MFKTVSVVMATFNGEKFIEKQIDSILRQLDETDELIISDDGSTDDTIKIIQRYEANYKNIHYYDGPHKGYVENFQFLFSKAKNELIMISDQDDIWEHDKINEVRRTFQMNPNSWVVVHDACFIDEKDQLLDGSIFDTRNAHNGFARNLIKSMYYGCCMTLKRDYLEFILPFPMTSASYDQWIGLFAELKKKSVILNKPLIRHRLHGSNQSVGRGFFYRLWFRVELLKYIILLIKRERG